VVARVEHVWIGGAAWPARGVPRISHDGALLGDDAEVVPSS
jgi:hypothetical protein